MSASVAWSKPDDPDPAFPPGGKKHVSDWVKELRGDGDARTKTRALLALLAIGPKPRAVIPAACGALAEDKDPEIRSGAAQLLGELAQSPEEKIDFRDAVEALKKALAGPKMDKEESVRTAAATALGRMRDRNDVRFGVVALVEALKDKPDVQMAAAASIDRLDRAAATVDSVNVVEAMLLLLKDPGAPMLARCSAATFVARQNADGSITALSEVLGDDKAGTQLRQTAADMLGRFKENADSAVPVLARALTAKEVEIRIAAGTTLAKVGPRARDALPQLREALRDENGFVRNRAVNVIGRLGPDAADALKDLVACLKSEKVVENRIAVLQALGQMGPQAKEAAGLVAEFTRSPNATVKEAATEALKKIEGQ
jgi:HEAT repeat protein